MTDERSPFNLINPLWCGSKEVTLHRRDWQRVLEHYGADYLHMVAGVGCHLKAKYVRAGMYSVSLEAVR